MQQPWQSLPELNEPSRRHHCHARLAPYVEVQVEGHRTFRRRERDILLDLPVALHEAVLGAKIPVPTARGPVTLTIAPGSNTGDTLRLKGRGVPAVGKHEAGDQLVTLGVVLPRKADAKLAAFLEDWAKDQAYDQRQGMGQGTGQGTEG